MIFPVSGVEAPIWLPPLVALIVSSLTASAGVSGAFLLLPFQVSVLHFTSPAVSPTNLIYNIVAIPGGLYRYIREGRMAWPLTAAVTIGTLPGVFIGAIIRVKYLPDPRSFKFFVGIVLLYLGAKLLYELTGRSKKGRDKPPGLDPEAVVKTKSISWRKIEYTFWGETFAFNPMALFALSLAVGLVGGIYGIGGGAIIAPFVVSVMGLPIYTVAGAALAGTFVTSIAGVAVFEVIARMAISQGQSVEPDWLLGALFGIGGLAGTYIGARLQKFIPEKFIRALLALLVTALALSYIIPFVRG
jgi:hypothetical protein